MVTGMPHSGKHSGGHVARRVATLSAPRPASFGSVNTDAYAAARKEHVAAAARPDAVLALVVLALVVLGLVMVQSASQFADPIDPGYFARRDLVWAALGGAALWLTSQTDYHRWRYFARPALALVIMLVLLTLRLSVAVGGAQRWLALGSFLSFQPSEIAKLALILFAADWLAHHSQRPSLRSALPVVLAAITLVGLVLWQNDLGTAIIIASCATTLLVVAGVPLAQLAPAGALLGGVGTLVIAATPFRQARLSAFLHPLDCGSAVSYHVCQSLVSLGSGGLLGRGLGDSLQKAGYLPAPFTDSIFAVIGEELGLWGALLVIALFAVLLWRGLRVARRAPDAMGALLAAGVVSWLVTQAILNIGSSVAAIPFTGVPLPFVSFGGSSLIVSLAAVGIVLNISAQSASHAAKNDR